MVCGHTSRDMGGIGQRCGQKFGGKRCKGVNSSALNTQDWEECPTCQATGREGGARCPQCDGDGWRYVRDMPRRG
jgi:hypothetical protein